MYMFLQQQSLHMFLWTCYLVIHVRSVSSAIPFLWLLQRLYVSGPGAIVYWRNCRPAHRDDRFLCLRHVRFDAPLPANNHGSTASIRVYRSLYHPSPARNPSDKAPESRKAHTKENPPEHRQRSQTENSRLAQARLGPKWIVPCCGRGTHSLLQCFFSWASTFSFNAPLCFPVLHLPSSVSPNSDHSDVLLCAGQSCFLCSSHLWSHPCLYSW